MFKNILLNNYKPIMCEITLQASLGSVDHEMLKPPDNVEEKR